MTKHIWPEACMPIVTEVLPPQMESKLNKFTCITALIFVSLGLIANSNAATVYAVSSTTTVNCSNSPHGLWTSSYQNTGCEQYFDFQTGSTLTIDGGTATLNATAINNAGLEATINLIFGEYQNHYSNVKEGGGTYNPGATDGSDWDFFSTIESGFISFSNGETFAPLLVNQGGTSPVMQIGLGADDKTTGFGASAWLDPYFVIAPGELASLDPQQYGNHWDLNMTLTPLPIPAPFILFASGLALLSFMRGKASK